MNTNLLLHKSRLFLKRNASTILTYAGAAGTVATTVMAIKATPKALMVIDAAEELKGEELTSLEKVKVAGPIYIPTILTGAATLTCIFGANILNKRQQASLMSAYALVDKSYKDYKKKIVELYGDDADRHIISELMRDDYNEDNFKDDNMMLFYDEFSRRYFRATLADVISAEYSVNKKIREYGGAYLNEFYEPLGIDTDYGYDLGWSNGRLEDSWREWLNFEHEKVVMDDGLECTIVKMEVEPVIDFLYY